MISGGMSGAIIIGTLLIILAGVLLVLAVMVAPETGGIGSVILAYFGLVNLYGAIIAFYGKLKADEFFECISKILGLHLAVDSIEQFLNTFWKFVARGLVIIHGIWHFKHCLQELYAP